MNTPSQTDDAARHVHRDLQALATTAGGPIVALDTSTPLTSLAFVDPEHGVHELHWDAPERPCVVLIEGLRSLAHACGRSIADIRALIVGLGPGSFTGLRVGLATAKGLSLGAQLPLYGASSLMMTAAQAGPGVVLAMQDARRGELFAGLYSVNVQGRSRALMPDAAIMADTLVARVTEVCAARGVALDTLRVAGHGAGDFAQLWNASVYAGMPRALWGCVACAQDIAAQRSVDAVALIPQYLRLSEPERQQLARQTQC